VMVWKGMPFMVVGMGMGSACLYVSVRL